MCFKQTSKKHYTKCPFFVSMEQLLCISKYIFEVDKNTHTQTHPLFDNPKTGAPRTDPIILFAELAGLFVVALANSYNVNGV